MSAHGIQNDNLPRIKVPFGAAPVISPRVNCGIGGRLLIREAGRQMRHEVASTPATDRELCSVVL
jgi:hypothetical protein